MDSYPGDFPFGIMDVVELYIYESDADRQTVYMWIARFVVTAAAR